MHIFSGKVAPLTDATQSFMEKYKHRPIVPFGPRPDEFGSKAVIQPHKCQIFLYVISTSAGILMLRHESTQGEKELSFPTFTLYISIAV